MTGEMKHAVEVEYIARADEQEYRRLGQQFSPQRRQYIAAGFAQQAAAAALLYLRADAVDRNHEYKEHQDARHEGIAQVNVVVQPRIADGMRLDDDGLQVSHGLFIRGTSGIEHGAGGTAGSQLAHGAHILINQRTGHEVGVVGIERERGPLLAHSHPPGAGRDVVEAVNIAALHGPARFAHIGITGHDARLGKGVEIAGYAARSGRAITVYHPHGKFLRQPVVHQRSEEEKAQQRRHNHAKGIDGIVAQATHFAGKEGKQTWTHSRRTKQETGAEIIASAAPTYRAAGRERAARAAPSPRKCVGRSRRSSWWLSTLHSCPSPSYNIYGV